MKLSDFISVFPENVSKLPRTEFPKNTFAAYWVILIVLFGFTYKSLYKLGLFISTKPSNLSGKILKKFSELPSLPLIGPTHHFFNQRNDITGLLAKWTEKYGFCWRTKVFGDNMLFIQDPELLKAMFTTQNTDHLEKEPHLYKALIVGAAHNGLLAMPAKKWLPHRNALNPLFTYEALKRHIRIYQKHAERLAVALSSNIDKNGVSSGLHSYTALIHVKLLNIITEIIIGKSFESVLGYSEAEEAHKNLECVLRAAGDPASAFPWLFVPPLWNMHPSKTKLDKNLKDLEYAIKKIIKSHVPETTSRFALDLMISSKWTDEEILSEVITLTAAGHETVSGALGFLLWILAIEQSHQVKCQQEADEMFEKLEGQSMNMACFNELKYTERCVKETLRLFPSVPLGTTRKLKSALLLDKGMELKAGTVLTYLPYVLHRDPKIYPDPKKFDPDRFLPENVRNRHAYAYLPFSAGARNCIGWKAALLELTVLSAVLLRHFHIRTTDSRDDIRLMFKLTITPEREPNLIFTKRNKCSNDCCRI